MFNQIEVITYKRCIFGKRINISNNIEIIQGDEIDCNKYIYIEIQKDDKYEFNKIMFKYLIKITNNNLNIDIPGQYQIN